MPNINRDYIVQINCDFDRQYWKEFNLVPRATPMEFKKDDRGSGNFFIIVKGWKQELTLKMGLLFPLQHAHIQEIYPVFKGVEGQDTYIFEVQLSNEVLNTVGTFKYQFFAEDKATGKVLSSDIDKLKIKDCL